MRAFERKLWEFGSRALLRAWESLLEVIEGFGADPFDEVDPDPVATSPFVVADYDDGHPVTWPAIRDHLGAYRVPGSVVERYGDQLVAKVDHDDVESAPPGPWWADPVRLEIRQSDVDAVGVDRVGRYWWADDAAVVDASMTYERCLDVVHRWEKNMLGVYAVLDELRREAGR